MKHTTATSEMTKPKYNHYCGSGHYIGMFCDCGICKCGHDKGAHKAHGPCGDTVCKCRAYVNHDKVAQ